MIAFLKRMCLMTVPLLLAWPSFAGGNFTFQPPSGKWNVAANWRDESDSTGIPQGGDTASIPANKI